MTTKKTHEEGKGYRRVNILLTEELHDQVVKRGLSLSGLVRDLLTDRFSETTLVFTVPTEVRHMYDQVISNFGAGDLELSQYVIKALDHFLEDKVSEIQSFRTQLKTLTKS